MRLIEEKDQLWLFLVTGLRQTFVKLGKHPQQAGGVQLRHLIELFRAQDINYPFTLHINAHPVLDIEHGFAEKVFCTLLLQGQQSALNRPDGGAADVAVLVLKSFGVVANVLGNRAQVFKVEQQQPAVVGDPEDDIQYPGLNLIEVEQASQQQRPEIGNRGANRVAFLAKDIP